MTEQSRAMMLNWLESERWWPPTDFEDRLIDAFSKVGAMMADEQARVFERVSPALVALTDETSLSVSIHRGERAVMVFSARLALMDEDELTFHIANAVARLVASAADHFPRF